MGHTVDSAKVSSSDADASELPEDPHEGLQAVYENGSCWFRFSNGNGAYEDWVWKHPDECTALADQFASTPRTDWHFLQAQSIAKQLRDAVEAYRKAQQ